MKPWLRWKLNRQLPPIEQRALARKQRMRKTLGAERSHPGRDHYYRCAPYKVAPDDWAKFKKWMRKLMKDYAAHAKQT